MQFEQIDSLSESETLSNTIGGAMSRVPGGLFVLTAQAEERRLGLVTNLVQQVSIKPPMLYVAVAKGESIMPLISESRQFGLCQLSEEDKLIRRKFSRPIDPADDPFLGYELIHGQLPNLPILAGAMAYLECELSCHIDVEGDHDLFVGLVRGGGVLHGGKPAVVCQVPDSEK
ncbi:MAG: flavin reductase family protein [Phycisphaeraceae bacterium]